MPLFKPTKYLCPKCKSSEFIEKLIYEISEGVIPRHEDLKDKPLGGAFPTQYSYYCANSECNHRLDL